MPKKSKKVKDKVLSRFKEAENSRRPREDIWEECYRIYRAYRPDRDDDKSNLFIPYLFGLVETVVPRIVDTIFSKKPVLKPLPVEPQDIESAEAQEVLLDYQLRKSRFEEKAIDWIKQAAIYGNGYLKVFWDEQTETVTQKQKRNFIDPINFAQKANELGLTNISMYKEVEKEITKYAGPNVEIIDIFDIYKDPYAKSIEDARYVVHKTLKPYEYVEDKIKQGVYDKVDFDIMEKLKKGNADNDQHSPLDRQSDIGMANKPPQSDGMVEILEYWEDNKVVTLLNREIVARDGENPFHHKKIPFVDIVDTRVPQESYGIGEIEPNRYLQAELNTNRNQRIENVKFAINNSYFYDRTAIDEEDMTDSPNGKIPVNRLGQKSISDIVYPVPKPNVKQSAYTEEQVIKQDMEETSGVTQYVRGIQPSGSATATEITSLQREANFRFKQKIKNAIKGLEKVGEFFVSLNQQFITEQQYIRISGNRANNLQYMQAQMYGNQQMKDSNFAFLQVAPEDIAGQFDITVASSALDPLADKQVKRQQLLELLQISMQNGIQLPQLFYEIADTYDMASVDKVVEEYKQQMQQQQQLQQLKFQAQNKGNPQGAQPPGQNITQQPPNAMSQSQGGMQQ